MHGGDSQPHAVYVGPPKVIAAALIFCAIFGGIGLVSFVRSARPLLWKSTPCTVIEFTLGDDAAAELPFTAKTHFRFTWQGHTHDATRLGVAGWRDSTTPRALAKRFSNSPETRCYFPDGTPQSAVLIRPSPQWAALMFLGFGVSVGTILIIAHRHRDQPDILTRKVMPILGAFFAVPGLVILIMSSIPVWMETLQARNWTEVPATIAWSEVRRSKKSSRADICYEYQAGGNTWRNNQLKPGSMAANTILTSDFPPKKPTTCWVNPDHPDQSLLIRSPGWEALFTLFPIPFLAIGIMMTLQRKASTSN